LFPKLKVALGGQIFVEWRGHHLCKQLFCRKRRRVLFGRVEEMGYYLFIYYLYLFIWKFKKML